MSRPPHEDARTGLGAAFRTLADDRGRPIRRIRRDDLVKASKSDNPGLAMLANRLRAGVRSESRRNTPDRIALAITLTIGVLVLFFFASYLGSAFLGRAGILSLAALILLIVVARRVYTAYVRRGVLGQVARTAVAEGVCGSCAFSPEGAPAGPDGHTVCPECGAAWRADRIVSPHWRKPAVVVLRPSVLPWIMPGVRRANELFTPDDRGRFVQTPDSRLMTVRHDLLATVPEDEQRELARSIRRNGRWWRVLLTLVLFSLPGYFGYLAWLAHTHGETVGAWILGVLSAVLLLAVASVLAGSAFCGPVRTARVIVRRGRCGSCLTPLEGAPGDDQGRRVCDHCGAAWLRTGRTPPAP